MKTHTNIRITNTWSGKSRMTIIGSKQGQIADLGSEAVAIIFLLFVNLLMYAIFTISGTGAVATAPIDKINSNSADVYKTMTLATYLRAEVPSNMDLPPTTSPDDFGNQISTPQIDEKTLQYLSDRPELWQGKTYLQTIAILLATESDNPTNMRTLFDAITKSTFANQNKKMRFILDYSGTNGKQSIYSDVGGQIGTTLPERTVMTRIPSPNRQSAILKLYIVSETP